MNVFDRQVHEPETVQEVGDWEDDNDDDPFFIDPTPGDLGCVGDNNMGSVAGKSFGKGEREPEGEDNGGRDPGEGVEENNTEKNPGQNALEGTKSVGAGGSRASAAGSNPPQESARVQTKGIEPSIEGNVSLRQVGNEACGSQGAECVQPGGSDRGGSRSNGVNEEQPNGHRNNTHVEPSDERTDSPQESGNDGSRMRSVECPKPSKGGMGGSASSGVSKEQQRKREKQVKKGINALQNAGGGGTGGGSKQSKQTTKAKRSGNTAGGNGGRSNKPTRQPTVARNSYEVCAQLYKQGPKKYQLPKRMLDMEEGEDVIGYGYDEWDRPVLVEDDHVKGAAYFEVEIIWQGKSEKLAFAHRWHDICCRNGLSNKTYQGKRDPEAARVWRSTIGQNQHIIPVAKDNPGGNANKGAASSNGKKQKEPKPRVTSPDGTFITGTPRTGMGGGGKKLVTPAARMGNEHPSSKPGCKVHPRRLQMEDIQDSGEVPSQQEGLNLDGGSNAKKGNPTELDEGQEEDGPNKCCTKPSTKKRSADHQGKVTPPTSFEMKKATDSHGCVHCGILDMEVFKGKTDIAFHLREGKILHLAKVCQHEDKDGKMCGVPFNKDYKGKIYACRTGIQHCKMPKPYTEQCIKCLCEEHGEEATLLR